MLDSPAEQSRYSKVVYYSLDLQTPGRECPEIDTPGAQSIQQRRRLLDTVFLFLHLYDTTT